MPTIKVFDEQGTEYDMETDDDGAGAGPSGGSGSPERTNAEWASLRKAEKAGKTAEARATQAERELAFLRLGIDAKDPKASYFVKGYEGDIDEAKIREAAVLAGVLAPAAATPATPQAQLTPEQQASLTAAQAIAASAPGGTSDIQDPIFRLAEAMASGGQEAMLAVAAEMGMPIMRDGQD